MSRTVLALAFALVASPLAAQEPGAWKPVEKIERYAISGQTELDLYKSIGEKAPWCAVARFGPLPIPTSS